MPTIYILGGGRSDERDVSLRSSAEVLKAVDSLGYRTKFIDPQQNEDYLRATSRDIVLPILHGKYGEDGQLQKQLESLHIPFLGSGSESSQKCFDKWQTREILQPLGIVMPRGELVSLDQYTTHPIASMPHVLKIVDGGSSIGTFIQRKPMPITENITEIFSDKKLVIEELIEGNEITVPILGTAALPVIEIIPPASEEFDYENKYNGKTQEICPPKSVSINLQERSRQIALQAHMAMNCRHFSRVDIMIDHAGELYVLEINTIPGLTSQSLFPKAAAQAGIDMNKLVSKFLDYVAVDYSLNLGTFKV